MLDNLMFEGTLGNSLTGHALKLGDGWLPVQEQDGDIPSLHHLKKDGIVYEASCLNGIALGFSIKLVDYRDDKFVLTTGDNSFSFGFGTNLLEFLSYLNTNRIAWRFDKSETDGKSLAIHIADSGTMVLFCADEEVDGFYQVFRFDWDLYRRIGGEIKDRAWTSE